MRQGPVVVGVDGSDTGTVALDQAIEAAKRHHAPLTIVTGYIGPADAFGTSAVALPERYWLDQEQHAAQIVRDAEAKARERLGDDFTITGEVTVEQPIPYLLKKSETAGLLVVGTRGLGRVSSALLGSVSSALVMHAHSPVLVARDELVNPSGPVVVGVDGSEASRAAVTIAAEEADLLGVPLQAVHSWTDFDLGATYRGGGALTPEWDAAAEKQAATETETALLSESLAGVREAHPDLVIERTVVRDRPVRALMEASEKASLLVVGSRGRGGFTGMLLGSTSRALLASVSVPLLIVRPA
ncbi:universal stress protein [Millisia brevis]|uniref:universal stress protein n=1 Tax=Millisia brevis TaxID=264148 RepID=UPI00082DE63B|nr:universal stress protein [Millisia brevis]